MIRTNSMSGFATRCLARLSRNGGAALSMAMICAAALAPAPVQAQYAAFFIPQPTSGQPPGTIAPIALNNLGQVLVSNTWGGPPPNRGPALYANGATVALSFPAGYHWADIGNLAFLNDTGFAVLPGQMDTAGTNAGIRPIVFQGGTTRVIPLPMTPDDCGLRFANLPPPYTQQTFNVFPMGLNRVGHVLIYACNSLWLVDSNGNILQAGPPPADLPPIGLQPVYFEELFGNHLNDADVASAETGAPSIAEGTHAGVLTGLSSFAPLPVDFAYALAINNHNQLLAFVQPTGSNVADCLLGTGSAVADLGSCAAASLNNLGQVVFMTSSFQGLPRLYTNGNVVALTLPPEAPGLVFTGSPRGLNDAGQIIGFDMFSRGVLLTPTGACAADVTAQASVRHPGLRLDPATGHYTTTVRVKNNGTTTLAAPISIVVDGLPATATLVNTSGATSCDPPAGSAFVNLSQSIAPGRTVTGTLEFIDPSGGRLRYTTRVLAGAGRR